MKAILLFVMGMWEWILILAIVIIFFGAKKIPGLARGFGKGIREFQDAVKEGKKDESEEKEEGSEEIKESDQISEKKPDS